MDIISLANKIMQKFEQFSDGVRVQMLIDRGVGNTNRGSHRWLNKMISSNPEHFRKNLEKLLTQQYKTREENIRLYCCVNARNIKSAVKQFQHAQIDVATEAEMLDFYQSLNNKFVSCLMRPGNNEAGE